MIQELDLQKFIRTALNNGDNIDSIISSLETTYGIITKTDSQKDLYLFVYDQLDSDPHKRTNIVRESRGIILNSKDNFNIVHYPYNRFFNYDEKIDQLDLQSLQILEKVDGSLIGLWYHNNQWNISTKGVIGGGNEINNHNISFKDHFWNTFNNLQMKHLNAQNAGMNLDLLQNYCFMLELITPENKVICKVDKPRIVLHGVRNLKTLQEVNIHQDTCQELNITWKDLFSNLNWEIIKQFPLKSQSSQDYLQTLKQEANTYSPLDLEGFVCVDKYFNRVKIKSDQYVALSHIKDGMSNRRILELIKNGEKEEVLAYFPEYLPLFQQSEKIYSSYTQKAEEILSSTLELISLNQSRKDIAMHITNTPIGNKLKGIIFAVIDGKYPSITEALKSANISYLEKLILPELKQSITPKAND